MSNSLISGIPASKVDVRLFKYSAPIENKAFAIPDDNGDKTLLEAWQRECKRLNKIYPNLDHWIDTEQPDAEGVYYRGLPKARQKNIE